MLPPYRFWAPITTFIRPPLLYLVLSVTPIFPALADEILNIFIFEKKTFV